MIYAGIDYSLSCPAICLFNDEHKELKFSNCLFCYVYKKPLNNLSTLHDNIIGFNYPKYEHELDRYEKLANLIASPIMNTQYFIEDYSYSSVGKVFTIAENMAILKYLIKNKYKSKYYMISPTKIKKLSSGKGNANKLLMHESFVLETFPDDLQWMYKYAGKSPLSDIIDSYYVLKSGFQILNEENQLKGIKLNE